MSDLSLFYIALQIKYVFLMIKNITAGLYVVITASRHSSLSRHPHPPPPGLLSLHEITK